MVWICIRGLFVSSLLSCCLTTCYTSLLQHQGLSEVPSLTDNSSVSTPLHVSVVISENAGLGSKETYCSGDKRKDQNQSDSPLQVSFVFTGGFISSIDHSYVTVCRNICSFLFFSWWSWGETGPRHTNKRFLSACGLFLAAKLHSCSPH